MTILPAGLAQLDALVQDGLLVREFRDALYPQILFRGEASAERWNAQEGETAIYTRKGLLDPALTPLTPGQDMTPKQTSYEQWSVTCAAYGDAVDVHMPSSRTALASLFASNLQTLGLQAGHSLNRLVRNKLFMAYLAGDTVAAAAGSGATALVVASINGFTHTVVNGAVVPVSVSNPKTITIAGVGTRVVTAATPASASIPYGPGTLTLSASATWAANARVLSSDASTIIRTGGVTTVDGLTSQSKLCMADIRKAVGKMRQNRVPTHPDGLYHLHLDPTAEADLFSDNELQRQIQGVPEASAFREMALGVAHGCLLIPNNESPNFLNSGDLVASRTGGDADATYSPEYMGEVTNSEGVRVLRSILTGGGVIREKYVDEVSEFTSEVGKQQRYVDSG
jgi:hypothetical protein